MSMSAYYSTEAQRCRELAGKSALIEAARRWLQLATDYESLAQSQDSAAPSIVRLAAKAMPAAVAAQGVAGTEEQSTVTSR